MGDKCEVCDEPLTPGDALTGCEICGRLHGACCNSFVDDVCVDRAED